MLVKTKLEQNIQNALEKAMQKGFEEALKIISNAQDNGSAKSVSDVAKAFANRAKSCAGDIATAIDEYIKSATITINTGTVIAPMSTLVSPAGPVTGVITLAAPTILTDSIK